MMHGLHPSERPQSAIQFGRMAAIEWSEMGIGKTTRAKSALLIEIIIHIQPGV